MKLDEYTTKVQTVVGRISAVEFDARLLRESRQTEFNFVDQLDVYRKRPRLEAFSIPVIPMRRVDARYSRLCKKEFECSSSDVKCLTFDVMPRKTMVLDASAIRCVAGAVSEIAVELQHGQ